MTNGKQICGGFCGSRKTKDNETRTKRSKVGTKWRFHFERIRDMLYLNGFKIPRVSFTHSTQRKKNYVECLLCSFVLIRVQASPGKQNTHIYKFYIINVYMYYVILNNIFTYYLRGLILRICLMQICRPRSAKICCLRAGDPGKLEV